MKYLVLILCSLTLAVATYPSYEPYITRAGMSRNFIGGIDPGLSSTMTGSFQPGYRSLGYMGLNRFMSGGAPLGGGIERSVAPVSTGGIGLAPRTYTTTRITVFPPVIRTGTSSFSGGNNGYNGMSGIFGSAPYLTGGMTGVTGVNPYIPGAGGMASISGGSPFMAGVTPMSGSFNMGGIGGQSMAYYPYSSGLATRMNFPHTSTGSFNGLGGLTSFGGANAGFSPMMYHKKRGAY